MFCPYFFNSFQFYFYVFQNISIVYHCQGDAVHTISGMKIGRTQKLFQNAFYPILQNAHLEIAKI